MGFNPVLFLEGGWGGQRAELSVAKHACNPRDCRWKQKAREFKVSHLQDRRLCPLK